jgi:Fe-S cluster biosynthesis and repair protein YggX
MEKIQICPECGKKANSVEFNNLLGKIVFKCYKCNNKFYNWNNHLAMLHNEIPVSVQKYLKNKAENTLQYL